METYLAIDYGTERVGLARSFSTLAEPLGILSNTPNLIPEILEIINGEGITSIVVGLSENVMAERTRAFVAELQKFTNLPIQFTDETLSSVTVHRKIREVRKGKPQYTGPIDHFAAAEFLQEFLDDVA